MNSFFHFYCKFDAKIEIYQLDKKLFEVFSPSNLSNEIDLEISEVEDFEIKVFPLGKTNNISYSAKICFEDKLVSTSKQVRVFNLPQNHFYFVLFPLVIKSDKEYDFDKIEIEENKIKTLTLLNDINKHAKVCVYDLDGDKLNKTESYFVKLGKKETNSINPAVRLLEFFQDLLVLDYKKASEYFTSSLSDKLQAETIKTFFENFDECRLVNYYDDFSVILLNYKNQTAKVYGASFENNLISNIYEIE